MAFRRGSDPFDDPFFNGGMGGGGRGRDPFRAMEERMDAMMANAFGGGMMMGGGFGGGMLMDEDFGGGMLGGGRLSHGRSGERGFGGGGGGGGGGHTSTFSFSSSTYSSSDGRGGTYTRQVTSRSNGGAAEVREAIHDGFRGEQSASVRRVLADGRGRTIRKSRMSDGTENHVDTLHNMEADDCQQFDSDWRSSAGSAGFARLGGGGFSGRGERAALEMGYGQGRGVGRGTEDYEEQGRSRRVPQRALESGGVRGRSYNHAADRERGRRPSRGVPKSDGGASIEEID